MLLLSLVFFVILPLIDGSESVNDDSLKSGYEIYNLKGDILNTWLSWKIPEDTLFHIHLSESEYTTEKRIDAIFQVIMSEESIILNDNEMHSGYADLNYYLGWSGALNSIDTDTKFPIPKNIHFHTNSKSDGHVNIRLENQPHPKGYAGFTQSIADESNNQILKSEIKIYDVENLSIPNLKTIVRHESGHAFGLGYSTDPEDLMHPTIHTSYPFISPCVLDTITELYHGSQKSEVICQT